MFLNKQALCGIFFFCFFIFFTWCFWCLLWFGAGIHCLLSARSCVYAVESASNIVVLISASKQALVVGGLLSIYHSYTLQFSFSLYIYRYSDNLKKNAHRSRQYYLPMFLLNYLILANVEISKLPLLLESSNWEPRSFAPAGSVQLFQEIVGHPLSSI